MYRLLGKPMALLLLAAAGAVTTTSALSIFPPTVPTASTSVREASSNAFDRIKAVELTSVATGESTLLTNSWRNGEILPFRNQRCVVEFLRHFG